SFISLMPITRASPTIARSFAISAAVGAIESLIVNGVACESTQRTALCAESLSGAGGTGRGGGADRQAAKLATARLAAKRARVRMVVFDNVLNRGPVLLRRWLLSSRRTPNKEATLSREMVCRGDARQIARPSPVATA